MKIKYLDGIRGLCCAWVLLEHSLEWGGWYQPIPNAKIAVDIFMILSGYLMVTVWRGDFKSFYFKRFLRIAPLYYLTILTVFLLGEQYRYAIDFMSINRSIYPGFLSNLDWQNFLVHVTFLFGLIPKYAISVGLPDWSIGSEVQFYLLFPFLLMWLRKTDYWLAIFLGIFAEVLRDSGIWQTEPSLFFLKAPQYLIGILIAEGIYHNQKNSYKIWMFAAILATIQGEKTYQNGFLLMIVLFLVVASRSQEISDKANQLIGNRFFEFLASTSYGVYLFHIILICLIGKYLYSQDWFFFLPAPIKAFGLLIAVASAAYPLSILLYRVVEKPCIELGKTRTKISNIGIGSL